MRSVPELTRRRVSILHKGFIRACDNTSAFQIEDLQRLRQRFAINANTLKIPDAHKWLIKITQVFENMTALRTPSERLAASMTVSAIYNDNEESFRFVDPDSCRLGLQKISIGTGPDDKTQQLKLMGPPDSRPS